MKNVLLGVLAGTLGGLAMKAVVRFVDPASFGLSTETDAKTAHEIWRRMGWKPLSDRRAAQIGAAMHYGFAAGSGALYAAVGERWPALRTGGGAAFGAALWLVGDELAVSVSGLEDPRRTPLLSHVSALGAHVLYGVTVELTLRAAIWQ